MTELVQFRGALAGTDDSYTERGPIWINPARVAGAYDHTILIDGYKIRVMETEEEIMARLTGQTQEGENAMNHDNATVPAILNEIVDQICEHYCKFHEECLREKQDDDALHLLIKRYCVHCPLNRLL